MRHLFITALAAGLLTLTACHKTATVHDPIMVASPTPTTQVTKVSLDETQKGYVQAGNAMSLRFLQKIYGGKNLVCSPLSLQYALAMTANGASGETLQEIIDFLGYGQDGIDALNAYSKILLEQLPAVDLKVSLKVTDALLVNNRYPLQKDFRKTVTDSYYAAVSNMDFSDPAQVAARINDWTRRSTNGFIDKVMDSREISPDAAAFLMNALYFKAHWAGSQYHPMFKEYGTHDAKFTRTGGSSTTVRMMQNTSRYRYAIMDGFRVVAIPYENYKYFMYILLPDKNDLEGMLGKLQETSWHEIISSFKQDADVHLKLPKFDIENKFDLRGTLNSLGVQRAFDKGNAEFDRMIAQPYPVWIEKVIQKARISVAEWGTEAAAVTVVEMDLAMDPGPGEEPKKINFFADHPFVFAIGEHTSETILFEGVFAGE